MRLHRALGLLPLALLLIAWEVAVELKVYPPVLLPPPAKVALVFIDDWPTVLDNALASITRVVIGISLSFLFAVPLGLMIGRYQILDTMTDWSIQIFRSIPPISLIPLALLFLGIGDKPAIALIFLAGTWPLLINTIFGVRTIERTLIKVARAARASEFLVMKDIILPASLPAIFTGLRLAVGGGWLTVVTAEMIAVKSGLGYMILNAQLTFRSDLIIAGIIVIGSIGLLADQLVRLVRSHVCRWQEGDGGAGMNRFIECVGVGKIYPGKTGPVEALRGIDFSCNAGDFVCLLGRSGCGKSTLLQMIAGLETPTTGQIAVAGRELDGPSPDAAIVFQDHGLFPWMTVTRNVEFNMKASGLPAAARAKRARGFIAMTSLLGFEDRYPHELSGGMRQRVGIARALTTDPKALLMDEPFGALDAQTRGNLQDELLQIWQKQRTTVLFVTHSIDEALLLADRILVFTPRPGRIAADIAVDLPRPRAPQSAQFSALARELRGLVGAERDFD